MDHKREQLNGWCEVSLKRAVFPRREKVLPQDCPDLPYLGMDNVEGGTGRVIETRRSDDMRSAAARFYTGDVLYGRLRPYLNKVVCASFDGLASAEFIILPGNSAVDSQFLSERLRAADFVSFAAHLNEGDRPRVNFDQIGDFELRLPPKSEQRRIVAKIEELFSELDKGVESLKTARAQLKTYRQSLLKAAFEGRLTEQWRRDNADKLETADQLLQRIREECEAQYQRKLENWKAAVNEWDATDTVSAKPRKPSNIKDMPDFTVEERADLRSLPPSWAWTRFGSLGVDLKRGPFGSAIKKSMFVPKGYKVYEQGNAIYRDETRGNYYINEEKFSDLIGFAVEPGDFIVSCAGTVGRIFELPDEASPGVINQALMRIRINGRIVNKRFFEILFESDHFQRRILKDAKGTAMSNLAGIKELNLVPVAICSIEEQDEVVRHIDQEISRIEYLDSIIVESMQRSETLRQSILKRAFEGKLVPQDPDDEPASVLLERIRAEQEEAPKPRGRRRKAGA